MMKTLIARGALLAACVVSCIAVFCQSSSFQSPQTVNTTNKDRDWHVNFLKGRISALQPADGSVLITGRVFQSPDVETHTVPVGHKITFPDHHGSKVYTIAVIRDDGIEIEYESTFDHRSFGKNVVEKDKGMFLLPWLKPSPASAKALSRNEQVQVVVLERMLKAWGEIAPSDKDAPQMNYLAVSSTLHIFGDENQPNDPSDQVMHALGMWQARKFSESVVRKFDRIAVTDRQTGVPGRVLWIGPIKWTDENTGETSAGVWENLKFGPGEMLRVHLEDGEWKVTVTGGWLT